MNMGRIILRNILAAGLRPRRAPTWCVPDCEEIDGVRCVPSVKDLPERVDVFVVAVGAEQVPELMEELVEHDRAVGVILIPGGMGEKEGGEAIEARVKAAIGRRARWAARSSPTAATASASSRGRAATTRSSSPRTSCRCARTASPTSPSSARAAPT